MPDDEYEELDRMADEFEQILDDEYRDQLEMEREIAEAQRGQY